MLWTFHKAFKNIIRTAYMHETSTDLQSLWYLLINLSNMLKCIQLTVCHPWLCEQDQATHRKSSGCNKSVYFVSILFSFCYCFINDRYSIIGRFRNTIPFCFEMLFWLRPLVFKYITSFLYFFTRGTYLQVPIAITR